ncbi:MAG: hypothetical protein AB7F75_00240 [Planctomycetota bacterium]
MNKGGLALTTVCILALLAVAKFMRPDTSSSISESTPQAQSPSLREVTLKVEFSRAGVGTAIATLLKAGGGVHSRVVLAGGEGRVELTPECTEIMVEAAGHRPYRGAAPEKAYQSIKLEVAGNDRNVYQATSPRPETKGDPFCALRFIDTASGELLRGVQVALDGAEVGVSNNNGEISVTFERLRAAKEFRADLQGYQPLTWPLNEAMVDELHVEPLLMSKVSH